MEAALLMQLLGMGQSGMSNMMSTGLSAIPLGMSAIQSLRMALNPNLRRYQNYVTDQFEQANENNIYGNPYELGGMFGADSIGGAASSYLGSQMNAGAPQVTSMQNMANIANMQGPTLVDSTSGMRSLLGAGPSGLEQPAQATLAVPTVAATPTADPSVPLEQSPTTELGGRFPGLERLRTLASNVRGGEGSGSGSGGGSLGNMFGGAMGLLALRRRMNNRLDGIDNPYVQFWRDSLTPGRGKSAPSGGARGRDGEVLDSYAKGTTYVPQTGNYKLHQGEAVVKANENPYNPSAPVNNNVRTYLNSPLTYNEQTLNAMIGRGKGTIDTATAGTQRRLRDLAAGGGMNAGAYNANFMNTELSRLGQLAANTRDVGITAAQQNAEDLRNAATFQFGAENALANQTMAENQFRNQVFNENRNFSAGANNAINDYALGANEYGNSIFDRLLSMAQAGSQFPNSFLSRAIQMQLARIAGPGSIMPSF